MHLDYLLFICFYLQNLKRPSDFAFRMGGEEFSAIFTISQENNAFEFSEHLRKAIENLQIEHKKM